MPSMTASIRPLRYFRAQVSLFLLILACLLLPEMAGAQAALASAQRTIVSGLNEPVAIAVDANGNVYIVDSDNNRVLKETLSAGSYTQSTIGSGLDLPQGVAVDGSGNVYISDAYERVLKETLSAGSYTQSTIVSGLTLAFGVAVDASGNVYVAEAGNNRVLKETLSAGSYTQSVIVSGLNYPYGIAVDASGNLYIGEKGTGRMLKETLSGGSYAQSTIASGVSTYGVAVDASGDVYFVGYIDGLFGDLRVLKETPEGTGYTQSALTTFGVANPFALAVDGSGNVYIADARANIVYIDNDPDVASPLAGNFGTVDVGGSSTSTISEIFTFVTAGTPGSTAVVTQGVTGLDFTDAGTGTCAAGTAYAAGQTCTIDINFAPKLAGTRYGAAELLDGAGNVLAAGLVQGTGVGPMVDFLPGTKSQIPGVWAVGSEAVDGSGNIYMVSGIGSILKETLSGGTYTQTVFGSLRGGAGLALDGSGSLYTLVGNQVLKATPSGDTYTQTAILSNLNYPSAIALDGSGNIYIVVGGALVKETLSAGGFTQSTIASGLDSYCQIAVDGSGNVYIADVDNGKVLKETLSAGSYTQTVILSGVEAWGMALDGSGNVYTVNGTTGQVLKETPSASGYTQSTIATQLNNCPCPFAVDGSGNIYSGMWKFDLVHPPSLTFATTDVGFTNSDSPQTVTIENIGNAPLTFPVPATGNNPSITGDFSLNSDGESACPLVTSDGPPGTLPSGANCLLPISFTPTTAGSRTASLVLTDNALNAAAPAYATQSISFSGTGTAVVPAELTSLTPGSTLTGASEWFNWTTGSGVTTYEILVGTTGVGSSNIYDSGSTKSTAAYVAIPTTGATLYVQLISYFNGISLQRINYTFTEAIPTPATLTSPTGTSLTSSTVSFAWTRGVDVSSYELRVGTTGAGSNNIYDSGLTAATSALITGLPVNGATVYVQLLSSFLTLPAQSNYYTFTAATPTPAVLTTPAPGTALTSSSVSFAWTPGVAVLAYELRVGTTGAGSNDIYDSGLTAATSGLISGIPVNGATVYVQLLSYFLATPTQFANYTFTAATPTPAVLTTPAPGTALTSSSVSFAWTPGAAVSSYELRVGTMGVGSDNVFDSSSINANSVVVNGIPDPGATVYVQLVSNFYGAPAQAANYTFTEAPLEFPWLTSPAAGTTLTGSTQTFAWTMSYSDCYVCVGTTGLGSCNLYQTRTTVPNPGSITLSNLPIDGTTVYVRLWSNLVLYGGGLSAQTDYTFTASGGPPAPAALTAPTHGTTFAGSSQTFTWSPGVGVTAYELWVGTTGVSSSNVYHSPWLTGTSATVSNIPANGGMLYVRLCSRINGYWRFADYTFGESGGPTAPAALTSPTATTFPGSIETFAWTTGAGVTSYALRLGTLGPGSRNLYNSGPVTSTSATVSNIPANGGTVYVGLASEINGVWQATHYTFTESGGPPVPATLTAPTGTTLAGSSQTFTWTIGSGVEDYELWVGTINASSSNVYRSGWLTATSATVNNIPTAGGTVFVRLCSRIDGAWQFTDYTFTESGGPPVKAALTSPTVTTFSGSSQTFTWSAGAGVSAYGLRVGTTGPGSDDVYNLFPTLTRTAGISGIPTNGVTLYVRLFSAINRAWQFADYTFTEAGGPPVAAALTAPSGTTLSGSSQTFTWTPGVGVTYYELWVGTTNASSGNVYRSSWLTATSATVNNIPTSGGRVFVRLCSMINGTWQFTDYTFTESGGPPVKAALTSPTVTTLTGSSQTFTWSAGVGVSKYELRVGTTGYGSRDIYNSGSTTATSATVDNIPTNGGTVYVGVSSQINGVWHYAAYTFNAQ